MKKIIIVGLCLCILLVSPWNETVVATAPPYALAIEDLDAFLIALQNDHVIECRELSKSVNEHEEIMQYLEKQDELVHKIDFLKNSSEADLLVRASDKFSTLGYVPLLLQHEEMSMELVHDYKHHPFLLLYTYQTHRGEIRIEFGFKREQASFSADETYEEWQQVSDRYAVSRVDMLHGEGVFSLRSYGSSCQSCMGSITGKGYANLLTEYEDFTVEVSFLYQTDQKEAIAFLESLAIEKRML